MLSDANTFHIEEYKAVRTEIEWVLQEYHALERNIAVLCGGVLAWLFTHLENKSWAPQDLGFFVPFIFAILGSVRAYGIFKGFDIYHEYLMKVEKAFNENDGLEGWEHFLSNSPDGKENRRNLGNSKFGVYLWVGLDLVTFVIGIVFGFHLVK